MTVSRYRWRGDRSRTAGTFTSRLTADTVESPLRRKAHGGFGERPGETERAKSRHRAPGRLTCTIGPQWCQANHITRWQYGRRTCIDDGALLCGYHHREFENLGWDCTMINGIPHYRPPRWLDGQRTPQRNTAHDITAA